MSVINPSSAIQSDAVTGAPTAQKSSLGAAWWQSSPAMRAQAVASLGISANVNAQVAAQPGLTLLGIAVRADSGAPAGLIVNGGTAISGTALIPFRLAPNEMRSVWLGPDGIAADNGLSILLLSGTLDVVTFYRISP